MCFPSFAASVSSIKPGAGPAVPAALDASDSPTGPPRCLSSALPYRQPGPAPLVNARDWARRHRESSAGPAAWRRLWNPAAVRAGSSLKVAGSPELPFKKILPSPPQSLGHLVSHSIMSPGEDAPGCESATSGEPFSESDHILLQIKVLVITVISKQKSFVL